MDRFSWCDGSLYPDETLAEQQTGVAVYDGQDKVVRSVIAGFASIDR